MSAATDVAWQQVTPANFPALYALARNPYDENGNPQNASQKKWQTPILAEVFGNPVNYAAVRVLLPSQVAAYEKAKAGWGTFQTRIIAKLVRIIRTREGIDMADKPQKPEKPQKPNAPGTLDALGGKLLDALTGLAQQTIALNDQATANRNFTAATDKLKQTADKLTEKPDLKPLLFVAGAFVALKFLKVL